MDDISKFIRTNLEDYIVKELEYGYSFDAIKNVLIKKHDKTIVDEVINDLKKKKFKTKKRPVSKDLSQDMFNYLTNVLIDYIKIQKEKGYSLKDVKNALLNYGHSEIAVESAIDHVLTGRVPEFKHKPVKLDNYDARWQTQKTVSFLALFAVFSFWVASSSQESLVQILTVFAPIPLSIILAYNYKTLFKDVRFSILVPIGLAAIFFVFGQNGLFGSVEFEKITVFNLLFSVFFTFLLVDLKEVQIDEGFKQVKEKVENETEEKPKSNGKKVEPYKLTPIQVK